MSRIFAMGGGGFTMEPGNPLLDDFILQLSKRREPRILFLPTASGDTNTQINSFYARYGDRACIPSHLSLFRLRETTGPLPQLLLSQDVIYVSGGSMRNLIAIWRAHRLDELLLEASRRGVVLAGLSAGAMCWFDGGITCSGGGEPEPIEGLHLLRGSLTVHADGEPQRVPAWLACVKDGTLPGGWAADDGVGLLFEDGALTRVVSSRPGAGAQRVDAVGGELVRHRLEPELLGSGEARRFTVDDDVAEMRQVQRLRSRMGRR
jgi:peptidase E